ncbi:MAG TPA: molybdate ABC transporter substrate-binding protein [Fimbriimonas sp.]
MLLALAASMLLFPQPQHRTLSVFAAASLKEAFTSIAKDYEAAHRGSKVRLNFAGSQTLAAQINHGAPADVFASAAARNLAQVAYDRSSCRVFARNRLAIGLRKGLRGVSSFKDLAQVRNIVVADPAVPVGGHTATFLTKAAKEHGAGWLRSVRSHVVSQEADVKAVLAKVRLGEADAGIVYISDVRSARGAVDMLPIPDRLNVLAQYPVAIPASSTNRDEALRFIRFLLGPGSQSRLRKAGLLSPDRRASLKPASLQCKS